MGSLRRRGWHLSSTSAARGYTPLGEVESDQTGVLMAARSEASRALVDIRILAPALTADRVFMRRLAGDMDKLREIRHTNLVSVMDFDKRVGAIVYESVRGSTLSQLLHEQGSLELAASLVLLEDCVSGLEALHNVGVLHRNVTPDAVVVETTGAVLLRDAALSLRGETAGLLPDQQTYVAPEVLEGGAFTAAADLYAATAVFVEAIGGRASKTGVRTGLRPLLSEGMAKDPSKRSATLEHFRHELDDYARATIGEGWRKEGRGLLTAAAAAEATRAIRVTSPPEPAREWANDAAATVALLQSPGPRDQRILAGLGAVGFAALVAMIFVAHGLSGSTSQAPGLVLPPNLAPNIFDPASSVGANPTAPTPATIFGPKPTATPNPATNPTANPTANPTPNPTGNPTPNPTPNPTGPPPLSQTITFTSSPPSGATYSGSYTASATGGGSGNAVVFSSLSPTVCAHLSGGTFDFNGVGTCTIEATQAGNARYSATAKPMGFAVGQASQTISLGSAPPSPTYGGSFIETSSGGGSGNPVVLAADPTSTGCTQNSGNPSQFAFSSTGTCVINANQAGNADYTAAQPRQLSFNVAQASQTITFTSSAPTCPCSAAQQYAVTATGGGSTQPLTYFVDGGSGPLPVCTMSANVVTINGGISGTCTIFANQAGDANYRAAAQVQQAFSVS
jgi:serine/threonine protein kinase